MNFINKGIWLLVVSATILILSIGYLCYLLYMCIYAVTVSVKSTIKSKYIQKNTVYEPNNVNSFQIAHHDSKPTKSTRKIENSGTYLRSRDPKNYSTLPRRVNNNTASVHYESTVHRTPHSSKNLHIFGLVHPDNKLNISFFNSAIQILLRIDTFCESIEETTLKTPFIESLKDIIAFQTKQSHALNYYENGMTILDNFMAVKIKMETKTEYSKSFETRHRPYNFLYNLLEILQSIFKTDGKLRSTGPFVAIYDMEVSCELCNTSDKMENYRYGNILSNDLYVINIETREIVLNIYNIIKDLIICKTKNCIGSITILNFKVIKPPKNLFYTVSSNVTTEQRTDIVNSIGNKNLFSGIEYILIGILCCKNQEYSVDNATHYDKNIFYCYIYRNNKFYRCEDETVEYIQDQNMKSEIMKCEIKFCLFYEIYKKGV